MDGPFDLGRVTPFVGSRGWSSLMLWAMVRAHGRDGLTALLDRRLELTRRFTDLTPGCTCCASSAATSAPPERTCVPRSTKSCASGGGSTGVVGDLVPHRGVRPVRRQEREVSLWRDAREADRGHGTDATDPCGKSLFTGRTEARCGTDIVFEPTAIRVERGLVG